jgi:hypothetical protein
MNKELEALLLNAAKALKTGVVGVNTERARDWGVPVGVFVKAGDTLPGHSKRAPASGYYCPYSALWRPPSGECLFIDQVGHGDGTSHYRLAVLCEATTGQGSFGGRNSGLSLRELKAYLRGVEDGAFRAPDGRNQ